MTLNEIVEMVKANPQAFPKGLETSDKDVNEIENCLDALYGVMLLRLQQKPVSDETESAIKEITTFIGMLSDYYIKDRTEGLDFGDE